MRFHRRGFFLAFADEVLDLFLDRVLSYFGDFVHGLFLELGNHRRGARRSKQGAPHSSSFAIRCLLVMVATRPIFIRHVPSGFFDISALEPQPGQDDAVGQATL